MYQQLIRKQETGKDADQFSIVKIIYQEISKLPISSFELYYLCILWLETKTIDNFFVKYIQLLERFSFVIRFFSIILWVVLCVWEDPLSLCLQIVSQCVCVCVYMNRNIFKLLLISIQSIQSQKKNELTTIDIEKKIKRFVTTILQHSSIAKQS